MRSLQNNAKGLKWHTLTVLLGATVSYISTGWISSNFSYSLEDVNLSEDDLEINNEVQTALEPRQLGLDFEATGAVR